MKWEKCRRASQCSPLDLTAAGTWAKCQQKLLSSQAEGWGTEQSQSGGRGWGMRQKSRTFRLPEGRTRSLAKEASHTMCGRELSEGEVAGSGEPG